MDTLNPNGASRFQKYFGFSNAVVSLIQEAKLVAGASTISAQKTAKQFGWGVSVSNADVTDVDGVSSGVAISARCYFGMKQRFIDWCPKRFRSIIGCSHISGFCRGGLHCSSLYVWCIEGPSKRNPDLLQCVAQVIAELRGPWILAADFDFPIEVLQASGWPALVKGKIIAAPAPTCGRKVCDYFVASEGLGGSVVGASVFDDAGFHPHFPSRLFPRGRLRSDLKRPLVAPRKLDAYCPSGCVGDPERFRSPLCPGGQGH